MKIQIGEQGEMRKVRLEMMVRRDQTILLSGFMDFARAERVSLEIDADTLVDLVRAALVGGSMPDRSDEPNSN